MDNLLISVDFDKMDFPKKHTCEGEDTSPAIRIANCQSAFLAVTVDDWTGPDTRVCHWLMWDIGARDTIPENIPQAPVITQPFEAVQGKNDLGTIGYTGPCPPKGEVHSYYFNVYGLDRKLDLPPGASRAELEKAMEGHMLQYGGQPIATFQRE